MQNIIFDVSESLISKKKSIMLIEPIINKLREHIPLSLEKYYNILISVTEAVNNAIIHGNHCDARKIVLFKLQATKEKVTIIIKDEGKGFNPDALDDPRAPENLYKDHGRGVFLINELTDSCKITVHPDGTEIIMYFNV